MEDDEQAGRSGWLAKLAGSIGTIVLLVVLVLLALWLLRRWRRSRPAQSTGHARAPPSLRRPMWNPLDM